MVSSSFLIAWYTLPKEPSPINFWYSKDSKVTFDFTSLLTLSWNSVLFSILNIEGFVTGREGNLGDCFSKILEVTEFKLFWRWKSLFVPSFEFVSLLESGLFTNIWLKSSFFSIFCSSSSTDFLSDLGLFWLWLDFYFYLSIDFYFSF